MGKTVDAPTGAEMARQYQTGKIPSAKPTSVAPTVIPEVTPPATPLNTPEPQPAKYNFVVHESDEARPGSGLHGSMLEYLRPDYENEFKDLPEMERIKLLDFVKNEKWTPEQLTALELGDASTEKMKGLFPDAFPTAKEPEVIVPVPAGGNGQEPQAPVTPPVESGKLEEMDKSTLIAEYNKLKSNTDTKFNTLQKEFDTFKTKTPGEESVVLRDFEGLKTDFIGTYNKLKEKYSLPSIDLVKTQFSTDNSVNARLQQFQETELTGVIEKEFSLQIGEFDYEANEASKAGTSSFRWDELSNKKKTSLIAEQDNLANREVKMAEKAEEQQTQDTQWYAKKYFEGDTVKVDEKMEVMSQVMSAVNKGEESYEKHPFAMRNLLHGFFYEELKNTAVEKAVNDLAQQFATKGMYLKGEELPTDLKLVTPAPPTHEVISKEEQAKSPMFKSIGMTLNTLNQ